MRLLPGRRTAWFLLLLVVLATVPRFVQETPRAQRLTAATEIPIPQPILIRPRLYAAYGALIGAALLYLLYLYRGRAFILYWIAGWLLTAAAMLSRSFGADGAVGSMAYSFGSVCAVCAAGAFRVAPTAFPSKPILW